MITKIWGIKANKKSIRKGVDATLKYIKDEEKIYGEERPYDDNVLFDNKTFEEELEHINQEQNMFSVLNYMKNEHKTKKVYVSGYMCNPETATEEFYLVKDKNLNTVGKTLLDDLENQAFHIVQSFPDDLNISDDEVHQCGIELVKKLEKYQAVITSHLHPVYDENGNLKGKCKHNHILINSHMSPEFIDPDNPQLMKYHDCKETYMQLRAWNDEISIEHGFPIIANDEKQNGYSWFDTEINNQGKSWKQRVRQDIETNMQLVDSWDDFKKLMLKSNYNIYEGKHQTYITPEKQKVRGSTLGQEYTKEYLESYWEFKKELQSEINIESDTNTPTIEYRNLQHILKNSDDDYFVKIPRINKTTGKSYEFYFPLSNVQNESVFNTYIKEDNVYPIYRNKNDYLGTADGSMIRDAIYDHEHTTYDEQKKWETIETEKKEREDLNRILKEQEDQLRYSRQGWNNSKTNRPYYIGLYDENGKRRSVLEQIFILAIVVITNEAPEYTIPEKERIRIEKTNENLALIVQKPSWKIDKIIEAIKYARDENIENLEQLKKELNETGIKLKRLQTNLKKNNDVKSKMEPINEAVIIINKLGTFCESVFNMPDSNEKELILKTDEDKFNSYKIAKATLYHHGIDNKDKINDFKQRYSDNLNYEINLLNEIDVASKRYTRLKKIKYQIDLATNKNYCYGRELHKDKDIDKKN